MTQSVQVEIERAELAAQPLDAPTTKTTPAPAPAPDAPVTSAALDEHGLLAEELAEVPTFRNVSCCEAQLIKSTRQLLEARYAHQPHNFSKRDIELMLSDDWSVSRFLLRCRLQPERSVDLMQAASSFRREFGMADLRPADFPAEMHQVGALFRYAPDRAGNETFWMRVRMHRRSAEMSHLLKQFILCTMEQCDRACNGRGVAVVFDLSACGIKNADPTLLFWLLSAFRNYMPKGLSYILVYNLPWVLSATCTLAMTWLSSTNRKRLRFIEADQIHKYIAPENLPPFVQGGTCKLDYKQVPEGAQWLGKEASAHSLAPWQGDDKLVQIGESLADKLRERHRKCLAGEDDADNEN